MIEKSLERSGLKPSENLTRLKISFLRLSKLAYFTMLKKKGKRRGILIGDLSKICIIVKLKSQLRLFCSIQWRPWKISSRGEKYAKIVKSHDNILCWVLSG